ncbi:MAG TPA: thioredoxin domain-containing protein [Opitutaceae bacterium]|nr:thioredoxin domain-containing protein [Opitutaceae bacterium]
MNRRLFVPALVALLALPLAAFAAAAVAKSAKPAKPLHVAMGAEVKLTDYLVEGKTVIFDFYSDYCGPCKAVAPQLEALHAKRADIVVVKVDINRPGVKGIDWRSPVATQYKLRSIPHFKVYGPNGKVRAEDSDTSDKGSQLVYSLLQ